MQQEDACMEIGNNGKNKYNTQPTVRSELFPGKGIYLEYSENYPQV